MGFCGFCRIQDLTCSDSCAKLVIRVEKKKSPILPVLKKTLLLLLLPRALHKLLDFSTSIDVTRVWLASRIVTPTVRFGGLIAREEAVVRGVSSLDGFFLSCVNSLRCRLLFLARPARARVRRDDIDFIVANGHLSVA